MLEYVEPSQKCHYEPRLPKKTMFERYTEDSRRLIFFARDEAASRGSEVIEPEHVLLGLLRQDRSLLELLLPPSVSISSLRKKIEPQKSVSGQVVSAAEIPLSKGSQAALELAYQEVRDANEDAVAPKHILLGLIREGASTVARNLSKIGVELSFVRVKLAQLPPVAKTELLELIARHGTKVVPSAKFQVVLSHAFEEAILLGDNEVGTTHLLLGLLREEDTLAARVLEEHGVRLSDVRAQVKNRE